MSSKSSQTEVIKCKGTHLEQCLGLNNYSVMLVEAIHEIITCSNTEKRKNNVY